MDLITYLKLVLPIPFVAGIITLLLIKIIDKIVSFNPKWDAWWKNHKQFGWNK